jgi:hypothetical protein
MVARLRNKTNTTSARSELHVISVTLGGTGRQRAEHGKRIISDGFRTGTVEHTSPAQARPVVT